MAQLSQRVPLPDAARRRLEQAVGRETPGLTYALVREGSVSLYAGGRADAASDALLDPDEPMPLYSMTKAVTALATLEWLARRGLEVEADVRDLVPSFPFDAHRVRVVDLLSHTAGLPNPIPLAWVHRPEEHASFDERGARARVSVGRRASAPRRRYAYSNLGYWWLPAVIEALAEQSYERALEEVDLAGGATGIVSSYPRNPCCTGHVHRWGWLRLGAAFLTPRWVWGPRRHALPLAPARDRPRRARRSASQRGRRRASARERSNRPDDRSSPHRRPVPLQGRRGPRATTRSCAFTPIAMRRAW